MVGEADLGNTIALDRLVQNVQDTLKKCALVVAVRYEHERMRKS
jgi:hypothetical protein